MADRLQCRRASASRYGVDFDKFKFTHGPLRTLIEDEARTFSECRVILEGTIRACAPEVTLERVQPHLGRMGITRVAHIGGLDSIGIPVSICYRPNSKHLSSGQGKGFTKALADASAVMECVEGYHMEGPRSAALRGSYAELRSLHRLVDPARLSPGYFSGHNARHLVLDWSAATNLVDWELVHVPTCLTRLDFSSHVPETNRLSLTSNGLAAGNLLAEAICHGIMEVVERNCLAAFNAALREERDARRIDLSTIEGGPVRQSINRFRDAGLEVVLWDMTDKLGIPSMNCVVIDRSSPAALGFHGGSGTHYDGRIAAMRALAEAGQSRAAWISGSRDDLFPERYVRQAIRATSAATHDRNATRLKSGGLDFALVPPAVMLSSFAATLDWLRDRLRNNGFDEILVVNHTLPEFNIPVVQVIVPSMSVRHDR